MNASSSEEELVASVADVKEKLLGECYEHPFKWDPRNTMKIIPTVDEILVRCTDQLNIVAVDADLRSEYLMYYVGQSYAYACTDQFRDALDSLLRGQDRLNELTDCSPDDTMFGQAFLHVTMSMRAFISILNDDVDDASKILPAIPAISAMDDENRAAVQGLRGIFYGEYGFEGFKLAVDFLSKAIEMNANESSWHFLKGKYLSRLRHVERPQDLPNAEEMYHLEQAARLKKNGTYSLFLAQMYHEMARCYNQRLRNSSARLPPDQFHKEKKKSSDLNEKSFKLYKESHSLKPDCPQTLFRCAKGFMRLPYPYRQEALAKKLLEKGLELIPESGFGNHSMAQYCERIEKDPQKAMKHLKICEAEKIFPAVMDLVRLEYQVGGATDTVQRLEALLENYKEVIQKSQILVLLSSYHLFSLNDLRKACEYAGEIKRLNGNYDYLTKQHQPLLTRGTAQHFSQMINLREVLMDEIRIAALEQTWLPDDKKYFEAFFEELSSSGDIADEPRYLKRKITADAEERSTTSTYKADKNERREERCAVRDRVPKSSFPKTYNERNARPSSAKASSLTRETNSWRLPPISARNSNPNKVTSEDETNLGEPKSRDSGDDDEVVRSMRKMRTLDSQQPSDKEARASKTSRSNALMMAVLDKYA